MLKMRLQRVGRKHEPSFRLVLTDSKNSTKSGRFKEILGSYDARKSSDLLKTDRIKHWLSQGVQATGTVHNLLLKHNVITGKKVNVLPKKTVEAKPLPVVEEAASEPVEDTAPETTGPVVEEPVVEETVSEPTPEVPASEPTPEPALEEVPASDSTEEVVK